MTKRPDTERLIRQSSNFGIPNNPRLPAVVMPGALPAGTGAEAVRSICVKNGWDGTWVWTVFDFHHFHPASHEALVCVRGEATLQIGGPEGPELAVKDGDALILPAGFGHRLIRSENDFAVVGCYPPGQEDPDIVRAKEMPLDQARARIAATPLPDSDPLTGRDGFLMRAWG